jgi:hypothetical protein
MDATFRKDLRVSGKVYSGGVEVAGVMNTANRVVLTVPAGGSTTISLAPLGTYLISASDNVRQGCVLLQTMDREVFSTSNTLIALHNWQYSTDGLKLTIAETDGTYDLKVTVVSVGKGYYAGQQIK